MAEGFNIFEESKEKLDFKQFLDDNCLNTYDLFNNFQYILGQYKYEYNQFPLKELDYFILGYIYGQNNQNQNQNQGSTILDDIYFLNRLQGYGLIQQYQKLLLLSQASAQELNLKEIVEEFLLDQRDINLIKVKSQKFLKKDEELIKQLEALDKFSVEKARKCLEQRDYQNFTCAICLEPLNDLLYNLNEGCSHIFHTTCLVQHIKIAIENRKFPIVCPLRQECKGYLNTDIIEEILDYETLKTFQDYTLKYFTESHTDEYSCCPTPDCSYLFAYGLGDNIQFDCPLCYNSYCLNCRVVFHENQTCKEYQINNTFSNEDQQFLQFVNGAKYKQCLKCKFWVEKNQGCDHMTCRCGYQFCYMCGGVYQQCPCVQRR